MNAQNKYSHLPLPLWEHAVRSKRDILFVKPESSSNSIMWELRFSSLRKLRLWIFLKKINFFGAADVNIKKGTILAGELQF